MWYEILPSGIIICVGLFLPNYFQYWFLPRVTGRLYMKEQYTPILQAFYIRDSRVNKGSFCSPKLEEVLPDEPGK